MPDESGWTARLRASLRAVLSELDADPDRARAAVRELRSGAVGGPADPVRDALLRLLADGAADAAAVLPEDERGARWALDTALDVLAARLEHDEPRLLDLVHPLTALLASPFLGPADWATELRRGAAEASRSVPLVRPSAA